MVRARSSILKINWYGLVAERARLVDRLIATLDADPEGEEAWAADVERRQTEMENGSVTLLPGPESLAELKAEFE